jgi:hypothetical protein
LTRSRWGWIFGRSIEGGVVAKKELPQHVKKYLADQGVAESDLKEETNNALAELKNSEVDAIRKVVDALKLDGASTEFTAKVH